MDKDAKILITGGHGFLGKRIVNTFNENGYVNIITPRSRDYDLKEVTQVKQLFADHKPDIVVHSAAKIGGIGVNRMYPAEFFYDNAMMNLLMVHESYLAKVKKFVGVGSVCSYPNITEIPFKEENLWDGYPEITNAPYGMSKKMMLVQTQAYHEQYNFTGIHLLLVNLYGPGDNFNLESSHVIPALIRKCAIAKEMDRKSIPIWGTGSASREFVFVDDAARGIYQATEMYNNPEPVNIGSGSQILIKDLILMIKELTGYEGALDWDPSKPDGQPIRRLDVSKAKTYFDFEAQIDFKEGLRKTIDFYMENYYQEDIKVEDKELYFK